MMWDPFFHRSHVDEPVLAFFVLFVDTLSTDPVQ
jgi:hypothetical protein